MSAAQQYGEIADGLRESLSAVYGSETEGAYALGVAVGAAVGVTSAVVGTAIGTDPRTMSAEIVNALVPPPTTSEIRTSHDEQREAERIGRLVLALHARGHLSSVVLRGASGNPYITVTHDSAPASIAIYADEVRGDGISALPALLDMAIDRIDREDWSR